MKKITIIILFLIYAATTVFAACPGTPSDCYTGTNPKTVINCSYDAVNATVGAASNGDTVIVPTGTATWATKLTISKSLTLQGGGIGNTVITSNVGSSNNLISATPTVGTEFRITGFTFDINTNSQGIEIINSTTTPTPIRIDNNSFLNCYSATYPVFNIFGTIYGVVYNNIFTGYPHFDILGISGGVNSWDNLDATSAALGIANNLYFEDNTITVSTPTLPWAYTTLGQGGKVVWRYNNLVSTSEAAIYPVFDIHGNQTSGVYAGINGEYYGNHLTANSIINNRDIRFLHQRGGKVLLFYNYTTSPTTSISHIQDQEEYDDAISATTNEEPQHVNGSYYWSNWDGASAFTINAIINWIPGDVCGANVYPTGDCPSYLIAENVDYFMRNAAFDGTTGVGCGTLAARPATCTTGVGYWATTQSCSDLTGLVGTSPTTPISGTLYKCTATNTWTPYYTPYTYPHPLRGEGTTGSLTLGSGNNLTLGSGGNLTLQ